MNRCALFALLACCLGLPACYPDDPLCYNFLFTENCIGFPPPPEAPYCPECECPGCYEPPQQPDCPPGTIPSEGQCIENVDVPGTCPFPTTFVLGTCVELPGPGGCPFGEELIGGICAEPPQGPCPEGMQREAGFCTCMYGLVEIENGTCVEPGDICGPNADPTEFGCVCKPGYAQIETGACVDPCTITPPDILPPPEIRNPIVVREPLPDDDPWHEIYGSCKHDTREARTCAEKILRERCLDTKRCSGFDPLPCDFYPTGACCYVRGSLITPTPPQPPPQPPAPPQPAPREPRQPDCGPFVRCEIP